MLRSVDDPALCEALDALIRLTQEKLSSFAITPPLANASSMAKEASQESIATLGDVLYAKCKTSVEERDWAMLVQSVVAGDQLALYALYERAHLIVLSFAMRICGSREAAEAITLDVFHDLWRRASLYDPATATVLAWIMNLARSRAMDPQRFTTTSRSASQPSIALDPSGPLQALLARRIAGETGKAPVWPPARQWSEPEWQRVAPGIECKLLATDTERDRVSMLVRLAPGGTYPAHTHAGTEELFLLEGELWIDGRQLVPGDYNYGAPGAGDERVWSETGCSCVLVTSTKDRLH
jgi:DNA-directed RNA polymerase specialized sigma24 family protein